MAIQRRGASSGDYWAAWRAVLTLLTLLAATGCASIFRPRALQLPEGFLQRPIDAQLLDPATRAQAYRDLFPKLNYLRLDGPLDARGSLWLGSEHFYLSYFALLPPNPLPASQSLRMKGLSPAGTALLDLTVSRGMMTVTVNLKGGGTFQGPIPPEGSPILQHMGVEPWDLIPIFVIGTRLGAAEWTFGQGGRGALARLTPASPAADGLAWIDLDAASGLPREALWQRAGMEWDVQYLGWKEFTDDPSAEQVARNPRTRLMPSAVVVERKSPKTRLTLTVQDYLFGDHVPDRVFQQPPPTPATQPLAKLNEILE